MSIHFSCNGHVPQDQWRRIVRKLNAVESAGLFAEFADQNLELMSAGGTVDESLDLVERYFDRSIDVLRGASSAGNCCTHPPASLS